MVPRGERCARGAPNVDSTHARPTAAKRQRLRAPLRLTGTCSTEVAAGSVSAVPGSTLPEVAGSPIPPGVPASSMLGTPAAGREAARKGRTDEMRRIYAVQLETPEAELAMEQALGEAGDHHAALLCFEREASGCHRSMLVERMLERADFRIEDI